MANLVALGPQQQLTTLASPCRLDASAASSSKGSLQLCNSFLNHGLSKGRQFRQQQYFDECSSRDRRHRVAGASCEITVGGLSPAPLLQVEAPDTTSRVAGLTGGSIGFWGATDRLVLEPLPSPKTVVLVRHGLSSWNAESRVQGSSDASTLSPTGQEQARRTRAALRNLRFGKCCASPITRARSTAEIMWEGREGPLEFLDTLREANLLFLEGMTNADAQRLYPEPYRLWRDDPANFHVDGVYPIRNLWSQARRAWGEILAGPADRVLVVTHKSILRALLCTALGLGPDKFRAVDVNNAGVCVFDVNPRGETMLRGLNLVSHLYTDGIDYEDL